MLFRLSKSSLGVFLGIAVFAITAVSPAYAGATPTAEGGTLGEFINRTIENSSSLPNLVAFLAYFIAVLFAGLGIYKLKNHIEYGPQSVPLADPLKFIAAGSLMFALPSITSVIQDTFGDQGPAQDIGWSVSGGTGTSGTPGTLDAMMVAFMRNTFEPAQNLFVFFCFVAGATLLLVAIHRLTKTAQEGPRGPAGAGTIATFVLAGIFFSLAPSVGMIVETLYGGRDSMTTVSFFALEGSMTDAAADHTRNVIVSVLAFMIIVGIISVARGFFILRGVAEGNQQMTMMGGLVHLIAGAILINFGQFANIIQNTLGITGYGVLFN